MKLLLPKLKTWWKNNAFFCFCLLILIFIPLYPKLPLAELIPGYLVRVRLEDFLILSAGLIWLWQLIKGQIDWKNSYFLLLVAYAGAGLLSLLVATGLQQTVSLQLLHLAKSSLHYFRYLEYFSLFVFFISAVKTKQHIKISLITLIITLNLVTIYGLGQKYLQWPVFSTMNREFSKGQALTLKPGIKLHSTFGGHYDLAAWLVMILPLTTSWLLMTKSKLKRFWLSLSLLGGGWLLWQSASKTATVAAGVALGFIGFIWLQKKWGWWKASLYTGLGFLLTISSLGIGLFYQSPQTFYQYLPFVQPTDSRQVVAVEEQTNETWSENAKKYGLSMGIRLDTLWPQALHGWTLNPATGQGYATLNRRGLNEFTEADSTDNNYLRILGETGLLGFTSFFGLIIILLATWSQQLPFINQNQENRKDEDRSTQILILGLMAGTIGLLFNALIIDVFAASKVAFSFWGLAGLTLRGQALIEGEKFKQREQQRLKKINTWWQQHWPLILAGTWLLLLVHKRPFSENSLVANFTLNPTQARQVVATHCLLGKTDLTCPEQLSFSPDNFYQLYLAPFYLLSATPGMYYLANLVLIFGSLYLIFRLLQNLLSPPSLQFLSLVLVITWPCFFQLPSQASPNNLWLVVALTGAWWLTKQLKISPLTLPDTKKRRFFLLGLGLGLTAQLYQHHQLGAIILKNYRDQYQPLAFKTIRRANQLFATSKKTDKKTDQPQAKPPQLISALEPALFELYGENSYQPTPLNQTNLEQNYQKLTQNPDKTLYMTNSKLSTEQEQQAFQAYQDQFGARLIEIDCQHNCNYYQLLTEPPQIKTQPQTWNQVTYQPQANLTLHLFTEQLVKKMGTKKLNHSQRQLKQKLLAQKANLYFITADGNHEWLKNRGLDFSKNLLTTDSKPWVTAVSNYQTRHTKFGPRQQLFALNKTSWALVLDSHQHHQLASQNVFLFNSLLQLKKHPQIKQVLLITESQHWLTEATPTFQEKFAQKMKAQPEVTFYFISPQNSHRLNWLPTNAKLISPSQPLTAYDYLELKLDADSFQANKKSLIDF